MVMGWSACTQSIEHAAFLVDTEFKGFVDFMGNGVQRAVVAFLDFLIHVAVAPLVKPLRRAPQFFWCTIRQNCSRVPSMWSTEVRESLRRRQISGPVRPAGGARAA
jgi:hypothetical protein